MEITKKIVSAVLVEDSPAAIITNTEEKSQSKKQEKITYTDRKDIVSGYTIKIKYKDQSFYFTLNFDDNNNLVEIFVNASSTSPEINTYVQALARLISNQLKYSIPLPNIIRHLDGMDSGESYVVKFPGYPKNKFIKSIPDLLAKVLHFYGENKSFLKNYEFFAKECFHKEENTESKEKSTSKINLVCSSCGSENVSLSEGCAPCMSCGYSKCS